MKLNPHHQHDKNGRREYRSPDETWRVVRTRRPGGNRNERPRWEVHERHEDHADWHCHAAFERRRDALVFLDTPAATPGGESTAVTTMAPKQRETPERSAEPPPPSPRRTPRRPITHDIDETRSEDIRWSLCGVFLYDEKQIAKGAEPATCGKCPAIRDGDQLPETPRSDEDCEEDRPRGGPRLERPRLSAAVSNLDVATGPPGAAGLPDVRARAGCPRRTRPVSRGRNVQPPAANA